METWSWHFKLQENLSSIDKIHLSFNKANAKNTQLYKYNNTNEVFYIKIPSSWTDIFPISSKYADILLEKLCSYIWKLLYVSKQGAHYFYKLLVKMMEELEFSVT